jgi:hypothetical protein
MNENIEYIKLLLAKIDGKDVEQELRNYVNEAAPYWIEHTTTKDAVLKFSNDRVPDRYTIRSTTSSMKGLRFGQYRPNRVEVVWVGKDFDIKDRHTEAVLYSDLQNVLAAGTYVDEALLEQLQRHWFVQQIGKTNG